MNNQVINKRKSIGRNSKIIRRQNKNIECFRGRWSIEEEKLFERNYKDFLNKKITIKQLKRSIPTRTFLQVASHITKMKYYLDIKFSMITDSKVKRNINEFKSFYMKNRAEQRNSEAGKAMIILNDPIRQKHLAISVENLLLLKSILPEEKKIKFDSNLIYNALQLKKSTLEESSMLLDHDIQMER